MAELNNKDLEKVTAGTGENPFVLDDVTDLDKLARITDCENSNINNCYNTGDVFDS